MAAPALPWRPEFLDALRMLARVSEALARRGLPRPVLVGGGAVEFYTGSAVMTGDIDVISPVQPELEQELQKLGFVRPSGPGKPVLSPSKDPPVAGSIRNSASASRWSAIARWVTRRTKSGSGSSHRSIMSPRCASSRSKT
jgi:hypothetical protein